MTPDLGGPLPRSYDAEVYDLPVPDDDAPCSGAANSTAVIEHVAFAQTHVLEPGWPFFFMVGGRPALVEAVVTGSGAAPDVRVVASVDGSAVGELCLKGPATLPTSVDWSQHDKADRYTATLPPEWIKPGLSITVTAGNAELGYSADDLGIGAAPELNLVMIRMDVLNYNAGETDPPVPDTWIADFAGAVPASRIRFGKFPARLALPEFVVSPDSDGGVPPLKLDRRPCRNGESEGPDCVAIDIPGMNIEAAALRLIDALHLASGEFAYTYYYGHTGSLNPGGWGGGKNFVGADFNGIFIHEMGHALSLPHWGEGAYQAGEYPYGGNGNDGGGRGTGWNYYQNVAEYVSPVCQIEGNETFGLERSDAMQRNDWCPELRSSGEGPWDGFGDFSAFAIHRFMVGAESEYSGTVPYRGGDSPFSLPSHSGFPNLVVDPSGERRFVREHQPAAETREELFDFLVPQAWDVPVATVYGIYHPGYHDVSVVYEPLAYEGTLPRVLDPTDPDTFADLAAGGDGPYEDYFWWPKDLTLKIVYDDDSVLHALYPHGSVDRAWSLGSGPWRGDLLYFALNVPGDKPIRRVELYERPFIVRYSDFDDEGNVANPELGITPQNYMDAATLVTSWERP